MKTILITGSSGLLGSNIVSLVKEKHEVFGVYKSSKNDELQNQFKVDLTDFDAVKNLSNLIKPDFIIHCAGLVNVEICEKDYSLARRVNSLSTKNLISCFTGKTRFIFISTDSIFDGKSGDYTESDLPSPLNNYAKSKLESEQFVQQSCKNYLIVRTSFFGWNKVKGESFAEWIVNSLTEKKPINMFTDIIFSPLYTVTLSAYIEKLLTSDVTGRLNLASADSMSKYEFGVTLAKIFDLDHSLINPMSVDLFNFQARRPKNMSLRTTNARNILGESMPSIAGEIEKFYKDRKLLNAK